MQGGNRRSAKVRILIPALVALLGMAGLGGAVSSPATATGLALSGTLYTNNAAQSNGPIDVYNVASGSQTGTFVPAGSMNGRGVAVDPDGQHLWVSWVNFPSFRGDGFIHELSLPSGTQVRTIPDPGGVNGPGIGALDFDRATGRLWAASYLGSAGGGTTLYALDPSNGAVLKTCAVSISGAPFGGGNDTLAVAHPAGLNKTVLLSDFGEFSTTTLYAIDPSTCGIVKTYTTPFGVTGIAEDPSTGHLIASDIGNAHDLGTAPYSSSLSSFALSGEAEDIALAPAAPQGNIFEVTFLQCKFLHVGYNRFKNGTVVNWDVTENGIGTVDTGQFTAIGGGALGSKTYHFETFPLSTPLKPEASGIQSHVHFHWVNGGNYSATRDPGC